MIPRTFPSTYASNGQQQMVVYFLPSIAGLQRWLDYIPVKLSQGGVENSYDNNGYIDVTVVSRPTATQQAWKEYIPVYLDNAATDAWRVNATGYIPYGYALFGSASMIMDMTNTGALDSRVTFSRTSNATQFDSAGNLVYAPHNLLTFSEQFDNAAWSKTTCTVTANTLSAPNGTTTAEKLISDSGATLGNLNRADAYTAGLSYTLSVYAKAGEWSYLFINMRGLDASSDTAGVWFNLANGTVGTQSSGYTGTITSVGDGWYRCAATRTVGSGANASRQRFFATNADNTLTVGDGTSGVFLWGAQLNVGTLQPYYPTTVKNLLGYTQEFDNAAWSKTNSSITANATTAPDGSTTADTLTATGTSFARATQNVALGVGTYTLSIYAKADTASFIGGTVEIAGQVLRVYGNLTTGATNQTTDAGTISATSSSVNVGNGWWRFRWTVSIPTAATYSVYFAVTNSLSGFTVTVGSSIFIWGAQLSDSASLDPYVYNPVAAPTAAAYYGPRFDYDPATLAARGLLIEEQRTQLLLWSEDFTQASWSKSNATATGNTAIAPSGLTTADTLAATANNGTVTQGVTTTAVAFTFSVYLKRKTGTGNVDISMDGTTWVTQTINSTTWTRCIVTQTGVAGTSNPGIRLAVSGDEVFAWGAQAE